MFVVHKFQSQIDVEASYNIFIRKLSRNDFVKYDTASHENTIT